MVREIKFRAWSSKSESIRKDVVVYPNGSFTYMSITDKQVRNEKEDIIMQYIGTEDKNNKEIYEGDIIKTNNLDGPFFMCTVDYRNGSFVFTSKDGHEYYPDKESEIIGNIYENKELLNKNTQ